MGVNQPFNLYIMIVYVYWIIHPIIIEIHLYPLHHFTSMQRIDEAIGLDWFPVALYRSPFMPDDAEVVDHRCGIPVLVQCARDGGKYASNSSVMSCHGAASGFGFGGIPDRNHTAMNISHFPPGTDRKGKMHFRDPGCAMIQLDAIGDFGTGDDTIVFQDVHSAESEGADIQVVVFLADPVHLSALMQLASFSRESPGPATIIPYGNACQQVYAIPLTEGSSEEPRGVLGMTDMYARRFTPGNVMSYAVPYALYKRMTQDMGSSFLTDERYREYMSKALHGDSV